MLERVRVKGVVLAIGEDKRLKITGKTTVLQQKWLRENETELLALLWAEDGNEVCAWCGFPFNCHQDGRYIETGEMVCGACDKRNGGWHIEPQAR